MGIEELLTRFDVFFDQSKKKQKKKAEKLAEIIASLQEKKAELKAKIKAEAIKCKKSKKSYNLCKEFKVLSKMLKKAQKHQDKIINTK